MRGFKLWLKNATRNTLVVNLFAGPGAGKTTCAWEIASKLKKLGYVTEYVGEYAKELVWDGRADLLDGTVTKQRAVYAEQKRRIDRLVGKVDFIVTDSPPLLSKTYLKERNAQFEQEIVDDFRGYNNFCIFVERGAHYEQEGRLQTEAESKELDKSIKKLLEEHGIFYGSYKHYAIDLSIQNMQTTLRKLNSASSRSAVSLEAQIAAAEDVSATAECGRTSGSKFSNKEVAR